MAGGGLVVARHWLSRDSTWLGPPIHRGHSEGLEASKEASVGDGPLDQVRRQALNGSRVWECDPAGATALPHTLTQDGEPESVVPGVGAPRNPKWAPQEPHGCTVASRVNPERPTERQAKGLPFPRGPGGGNRLRKSGERAQPPLLPPVAVCLSVGHQWREGHAWGWSEGLSGTSRKGARKQSQCPGCCTSWEAGSVEGSVVRVLHTDGVPQAHGREGVRPRLI